ncbi:MAG: YceI family protein [Ilumatobacteraceae bacterium]
MKTWHKVAIAVGAVVIVLGGIGAVIFYNLVKDDAPPEFTLDSVDPSGAVSTTGAASVSDPATPTTDTDGAAAPATGGGGGTGADGPWTIDSATSTVGYRVVEVLFGVDTEGVGRTNAVTGDMTVAGSQVTEASFTVDMTTLKSDEERRDGQFNNNLMETSEFPTATFVLTEPIELGSVPADGTPTTATATGDLTLKATTNSVTFDVQAQKNGDKIQVVGLTDIVFADYDIPTPNVPGITTQDHGKLEFDLHFTQG